MSRLTQRTQRAQKDRWDNIAALKGYHGPIDIYGAEFDGIIPIAHAKALATAVGAHLTTLSQPATTTGCKPTG